jgi:hypothetical protein
VSQSVELGEESEAFLVASIEAGGIGSQVDYIVFSLSVIEANTDNRLPAVIVGIYVYVYMYIYIHIHIYV